LLSSSMEICDCDNLWKGGGRHTIVFAKPVINFDSGQSPFCILIYCVIQEY